mmetsp:Transcript_35490/g.57873  ORF Transcript_35490/g.57873 Transcript_35490/m.57873 type:complete len:150 (-) Transcript_35490:261-710(-)
MARRTLSCSCLGTLLSSCASSLGSMDLANKFAAVVAAIAGNLSAALAASEIDSRGQDADGGGSIHFPLVEDDRRSLTSVAVAVVNTRRPSVTPVQHLHLVRMSSLESKQGILDIVRAMFTLRGRWSIRRTCVPTEPRCSVCIGCRHTQC